MSVEVHLVEHPPLRVVSAPPIQAVEQINELLKEYSVMQYHFAVVKDELILTALLINKSVIAQMQLANLNVPTRRQ